MIINRPDKSAGLYIHIPFCVKKCRYCDFLSFGGCGEELQDRYIKALTRELGFYRGSDKRIDTIFIGGGTPSLLRSAHIAEIIKAAEAAFCIDKDAEITIEANPGTLDPDKLSHYRKAGVNRLSIGVQSMDEGMLSFMGRVHSRDDFLKNYHAARDAGFDNINIDLMFGIPGQSRSMWRETLEEVIGLEPEHLSFYSLQLEEGTEFAGMYRRGEMDLPSQEEDRAMYHQGIRMLQEAGYVHYEISNCAKPGFQCRHNLKYWDFDEYLAAGLGAHSFQYEKGRRCNVPDLEIYFEKLEKGILPEDEGAYEEENKKDYMGEYVFTALRKTEGLFYKDFSRTFGEDFFKVYEGCIESLKNYEEGGFLVLGSNRLALTEKGIDISNEIMAEFV